MLESKYRIEARMLKSDVGRLRGRVMEPMATRALDVMLTEDEELARRLRSYDDALSGLDESAADYSERWVAVRDEHRIAFDARNLAEYSRLPPA